MHFSCSPPPLDASVSGYHHGGHNNSFHRNCQNLYQRVPLIRARYLDTCTDYSQEEGKEEEDIMIIQELDADTAMSDSFMGPTQRIYRHVPSLTPSDCFGSTAPHPPQNDMMNRNYKVSRIEQALSPEQQRHVSFIPQTCDDAPQQQQQQHFSVRTSIKRDSWAVDPSPWVVPIAPTASTKRMRLSSDYSYSSG